MMDGMIVKTRSQQVFSNGHNTFVIPPNVQGRVLTQHLRDYQGRVHAYVDFREWGRWLIAHKELQVIAIPPQRH